MTDTDAIPTGWIETPEPLTEAEYEDLKRRFLEAQKTQPIRMISYPEIDYPQELRDMYEPWDLDHMIDAYKSAETPPDGAEGSTIEP